MLLGMDSDSLPMIITTTLRVGCVTAEIVKKVAGIVRLLDYVGREGGGRGYRMCV